MRAGLTGCLLGIHASSPRDALCRLETLALLEELRMTPWTIRLLQAQTIQMLVHAGLFQDGSRRVTHVTECQGLKHQEIILHDLFVFQQTGLGPEGQVKGCFCGCGLRPRFFDRLREAGLAASCSIFELSVDVG
jgi:pilus assembly protein CpaF